MTRATTLWLVIVCVAILLSPFPPSLAKEASQAKEDVEVPVSSDASQNGVDVKEEPQQSPQGEEQERYSRIYKEYVDSFNKAENDEERERLRKKFEEETRAYQNSLAKEHENIKKGTIEKEKQALKSEYEQKMSQLKHNYEQNVRRLEQECRRDTLGSKEVFGEKSSGLNLEPAICQKKPLLEQEFSRDSRLLTNDYTTRLRALQRE